MTADHQDGSQTQCQQNIYILESEVNITEVLEIQRPRYTLKDAKLSLANFMWDKLVFGEVQ